MTESLENLILIRSMPTNGQERERNLLLIFWKLAKKIPSIENRRSHFPPDLAEMLKNKFPQELTGLKKRRNIFESSGAVINVDHRVGESRDIATALKLHIYFIADCYYLC